MNWYLFSGYAIFWILIVFYIGYMQKKQTELAEDLESLKQGLG